jgi:hypothetical protein
MKPESHISCSWECEGMNLHTPKWTPTLGVIDLIVYAFIVFITNTISFVDKFNKVKFWCQCGKSLHSVHNKHHIICWQIQHSKILMPMCVSHTHIKRSLHEYACLPQLPLHWHPFRMLTKVIKPDWNPQLCWDSCVARCAWLHFTCLRITTLHVDILWTLSRILCAPHLAYMFKR